MNRDIWVTLFFLGTTIVVYWIAAGEHFKIQAVANREFVAFVQANRPVLVDLRENPECSRLPLRYPQVLHWPFLQLVDRVEEFPLEEGRTYVLVCTDGNRARLIATQFAEIGRTVFYLQNGLWGLRQEELLLLEVPRGDSQGELK